eukprot:2561559-Amphidinium_carterae.1
MESLRLPKLFLLNSTKCRWSTPKLPDAPRHQAYEDQGDHLVDKALLRHNCGDRLVRTSSF